MSPGGACQLQYLAAVRPVPAQLTSGRHEIGLHCDRLYEPTSACPGQALYPGVRHTERGYCSSRMSMTAGRRALSGVTAMSRLILLSLSPAFWASASS